MNMLAAAHSAYEIDFGGGKGTSLPSRKALEAHAKARFERNDALAAFMRRSVRSGQHLDSLIEALVNFDRLRAGRRWKPALADRLAKIYREAAGSGDFSRLDLGALGKRNEQMRTLTLPKGRKPDIASLFHHDHHSGTIDPKDTGWYFEKSFRYSGGGSVTMETFQLFTQVTIGGEVAGTLRNPGVDGVVDAVAETGRWFDYTPDKTGYPNVACFFDAGYSSIQRRLNVNANPGEAAVIQTIDAAVGLLSGDEIVGRLYLQLDTALYSGDGNNNGPFLSDKDLGGVAGFLMNGDVKIEVGETVNVIFGIRVKGLTALKQTGASFSTGIRAYPTAVGAGTVETIGQPPPQW